MQSEMDARFAAVSGLGQFRKLYSARLSELLVPPVILGLLGVFFGFILIATEPTPMWGIAAIVVSGATGLGLFWDGWRKRRDAVCLYADGFAVSRRGSLTEMRWDEIARLQVTTTVVEMQDGGDQPVIHRWVRVRDGRELELPEVGDQEDLWNEIEENVSRRLLPDRLAAVAAGELLNFGPFRLDRTGLRLVERGNERSIEWAGIRSVAEGRFLGLALGTIVVMLAPAYAAYTDRWATVYASEIPDLRLFLALCRHFTDAARVPASPDEQAAARAG